MTSPILNARLPGELHEKFKATVAARSLTVTEAAREAVAMWVAVKPCGSCGRPVEKDREVYAIPTCHACLPPPPPLPVVPVPVPPANPLRGMREAAGLSQSQMAARLGMSKRAWQLAEGKAVGAPRMIERVRAVAALGKGGDQ